MPVYEYTALDLQGKSVSGIIDADSSPAARQKLRSKKIYPVSINETQKELGKKGKRSVSFLSAFSNVKPRDISIMTRQLSTLVGAGFPLVSALDTLIPQTKAKGFQKTLAQIKDSIVEGNSFASALSLFPGLFSPVYINMISAGESSGTLEIVLDRLAEITEKQQDLKRKIQSAMYYPILMSFLGGSVLLFLLIYIVPTIASIFGEVDKALPAPTQFLIGLGNFLKTWWWLLGIVLAGMALAAGKMKKTVRGRFYWDKGLLVFPGIATITKKLAVARFSRTLGSLLENGVSMLTALEIVRNIVGNVHLSKAISEAGKEVGKGQGLGMALSSNEFFPNLSIQMIQVGEQSGKLEAMLNKIAEVYETEVETSVMNLTALLEPVMIMVMGLVVGFIILAICLPIFEMNQLVM